MKSRGGTLPQPPGPVTGFAPVFWPLETRFSNDVHRIKMGKYLPVQSQIEGEGAADPLRALQWENQRGSAPGAGRGRADGVISRGPTRRWPA